MRVSVLGGGAWGTTVASLIAGHNETLQWARNQSVSREIDERHSNERYLPGARLSSALRATSDLQRAVSSADLLVVGVPSGAFRPMLREVEPHLRPWVPVISLTKGLEPGTYLRMTEVASEVLPGRPVAALSGPNLAKEIIDGQAAASVIATEDLAVARQLQRVLGHGLFRVYTNHDVAGCEIGGALKNVVAIATGIAQGLGVGDNTRASVVTRGLSEITRLGVAMGAEPATFAGLAGIGDLMATCMSPLSRNRFVGEQLGMGRSLEEILAGMDQVAEGVKTAVVAHELASKYGTAMPVCEEIYRVIVGEIDAAEAYRGLRRPGHEAEPG